MRVVIIVCVATYIIVFSLVAYEMWEYHKAVNEYVRAVNSLKEEVKRR